MNHQRRRGKGVFIFILTFCAMNVQADLSHLVPVPVSIAVRTDTFTIPRTVYIFSDGVNSDSNVCWIKKLIDQLHAASPALWDTATRVTGRDIAQIKLLKITNATLGSEGYQLTITKDSIVIGAQTATGQFYGIQTIRQMLPPQIEKGRNISAPQKLPGCVITDYPRFPHRGTHFDVARHFHNMSYLRQLVDRLALFKENILHLHLSDDQGWRIQISPPVSATGSTITAYNNLTSFGGATDCEGGHPSAGTVWYFTQAQLRDSLVRYALERRVNIIPEIDMPGHIQSAIAAFAQAGITISSNCWNPCNAVYVGTGVGNSCLSITNGISAVVDTFVRTVWTQIANIFPYSYLHMGGDECPVTGTSYSNFIIRAETIINNLGRKAIGWEDIYGYSQNPTTITQTWNSRNDRANSIFTWCSRIYFDQAEGPGSGYNNWCTGTSNVTLQVCYSASSNVTNHYGVESAMWTEMTTEANGLTDRDMYPRQAAVAELGWSAAGSLNWTNFAGRIADFGCRFDCLGIRWYKQDATVTFNRCATDSGAATNAYFNYNWQLVPVGGTQVLAINRKLPVSSAFSAMSDAGYKIIDVRGRTLGVASGKDLAAYGNFNPMAKGMYFVVDKKGNLAQKVLVK